MRSVRFMGRLPALLLFGYVWLMIGYFLGTITLMGPIQWMVPLVKQSNPQGIEDVMVKGMIGLFVLAALVSWGATKAVRRCCKGYLVTGFLRLQQVI